MSSLATGWANNFGTMTPWKDQAQATSDASAMGTQGSGTTQSGMTDPLANNPATTTNTTSAARMLGTAAPQPAAQQGGTLAQTLTGGLGMMNRATGVATAAQPGQVNAAATPTYTVSQQAPVGQAAVNSTGPANLAQYGGTYTGPQIVSVRTNSGNTAYYQFNPQTGQYTLANVYRPDGTLLTTALDNIRQQYGTGEATGYGTGTLTADQRAGAVGTSIGGGSQPLDSRAGAYAGSINQAYATQEGQYQNDYTAASTAATAANTQANQAADTAYILDYMVQHGGALPGVNKPGMSGVPMSQAAFDAAQQQYTANNSANFTNAVSLQAPDTQAVDKNSLAALFSLMSQGQTGAAGADAVAQQAAIGTNGTYQAGQNLIAHNQDYADKYNSNLTTFADAVNKQWTADANATGQKLSQDIMNVSDMLNQLQQSAGQLSTESQQAIQAQIQVLQNQISDYQVAAAQYGANSSQATTLARGVLQAGGSLATGGLSSAVAK